MPSVLDAPLIAEPDQDERTSLAPQYKVLVHDDDLTPMDFVVVVLERFFALSHAEAVEIMLEADSTGVALVRVLPLEQAELRVDQAHSLARGRAYPLTFSIEAA